MDDSPSSSSPPSDEQGEQDPSSPNADGAADGAGTAQPVGTLRSLVKALSSWRTASVVLLSFSSGMPLGLVWKAIPDWMRDSGVDIRVVGLFTLAQVPWTFNILWAPILDRFPLPFLGRRRGWIVVAQIGLALGTLALAGVGSTPDAAWVALAITLSIAFAAASQDIVIDAYAVDVLRPDEQAVAVGARVASYRVGMMLAGSFAITLTSLWSWQATCLLLALFYIPMMWITVRAPEPEQRFAPPKSLREAVWLPFLGFLSRHRALEILLFVLLFKAGDNFAQALLTPFLNDVGYGAIARGGALGTIGLVCTLSGAFIGGAATLWLGLGPALWIFAILQMVSNVGYVAVANSAPNLPLMFSAMGFENLTQGLGTGAFSVLLFRLTQRRFSATQYALFSTLFGLARIISGPIAGITVDAVGWSTFFWITIPLGLPGLFMLWRFVPWGVREPSFAVIDTPVIEPLRSGQLAVRGAIFGAGAFLFGSSLSALLAALKVLRKTPEEGFQFAHQLVGVFQPHDFGGWLRIVSLLAFAVILGLVSAAVAAARRGAGRDLVTG